MIATDNERLAKDGLALAKTVKHVLGSMHKYRAMDCDTSKGRITEWMELLAEDLQPFLGQLG